MTKLRIIKILIPLFLYMSTKKSTLVFKDVKAEKASIKN